MCACVCVAPLSGVCVRARVCVQRSTAVYINIKETIRSLMFILCMSIKGRLLSDVSAY